MPSSPVESLGLCLATLQRGPQEPFPRGRRCPGRPRSKPVLPLGRVSPMRIPVASVRPTVQCRQAGSLLLPGKRLAN
jgi:hypothetical protein